MATAKSNRPPQLGFYFSGIGLVLFYRVSEHFFLKTNYVGMNTGWALGLYLCFYFFRPGF